MEICESCNNTGVFSLDRCNNPIYCNSCDSYLLNNQKHREMSKEVEGIAASEFPFVEERGINEQIINATLEECRQSFIKGYQKAKQEAKIIEGMKMDEEQANKGVCKDCYYAGSFTCEH